LDVLDAQIAGVEQDITSLLDELRHYDTKVGTDYLKSLELEFDIAIANSLHFEDLPSDPSGFVSNPSKVANSAEPVRPGEIGEENKLFYLKFLKQRAPHEKLEPSISNDQLIRLLDTYVRRPNHDFLEFQQRGHYCPSTWYPQVQTYFEWHATSKRQRRSAGCFPANYQDPFLYFLVTTCFPKETREVLRDTPSPRPVNMTGVLAPAKGPMAMIKKFDLENMPRARQMAEWRWRPAKVMTIFPSEVRAVTVFIPTFLRTRETFTFVEQAKKFLTKKGPQTHNKPSTYKKQTSKSSKKRKSKKSKIKSPVGKHRKTTKSSRKRRKTPRRNGNSQRLCSGSYTA